MVGLVLCAGRGTRLKEETFDRPKCMVDIAGKPVLERIADYLNKHGINRIVVNLCFYPDVVMKHFGQRFLYLYEPAPMGEYATTALIKHMFPGEDLVVMNGDTLTDLDINFNYAREGRYCVKGKHMGITVIKSDNVADTDIQECWYQDMGTPEGLAKARQHYEFA